MMKHLNFDLNQSDSKEKFETLLERLGSKFLVSIQFNYLRGRPIEFPTVDIVVDTAEAGIDLGLFI